MNKTQQETATLTPLTAEQFDAAVNKLIAALKAPSADQVQKAAQLARAREQMRAQNQELERQKHQSQTVCTHKRQDGSSCVTFNFTSDGVEHGICCRCQKMWTEGVDADFDRIKSMPAYNPSAMVRP